MASMLPIAKSASAKDINSYNPPYDGEYTLTFGVGFEHLVPSKAVNSKIRANDLEGFNPGVFAEIGVCKWTGQHGRSGYEYHIGFMGRFDYHNFHSRAYNMNAAINAKNLAGDNTLYVDPTEHGCANVNGFMGTFNINSGIGWYGCIVDANCGFGMHADDHGNFGPVIALGAGIGYRFNERVKLNAKWRLNIFPFENLDSKTNPGTNPGLRHNVEIGVVYKMKEFFSRNRCNDCQRR